MLIVDAAAAVLVSCCQSLCELDHLPLQLLIAALQLSLLRPLPYALEVGCYNAVQLVFGASIAGLPGSFDDIALQLHIFVNMDLFPIPNSTIGVAYMQAADSVGRSHTFCCLHWLHALFVPTGRDFRPDPL